MSNDSTPHIHHVIGGGTVSHVRSHLALAAMAYGGTAKFIHDELSAAGESAVLHLTRMAYDPYRREAKNAGETPEDIAALVDRLVQNPSTKVIFFSPAIVDFKGTVDEVTSGKYAERMQSRDVENAVIRLTPHDKIVSRIREQRKDIYLVGFKTTAGADQDEMYAAGLRLVKEGHVNLVLANDTVTRQNMVIVPEEARYYETEHRLQALTGLVQIALKRSRLTFTRSTVLESEPRVDWQSADVPQNLRAVVDHLIARGAYKPFLGNTAGHFAVRGQLPNEFLTSARRENFASLPEKGLVRVFAKGADEVVAHAAKPSVGGQSQRMVFASHPDLDCIVHFHAPLKEGASDIPVRPQWMYECGSHECGQNTAAGLAEVGEGIYAVMLDNHGPNIVFRKDVSAERVIGLIESRWDLGRKTGGLIPQRYRTAPAP